MVTPKWIENVRAEGDEGSIFQADLFCGACTAQIKKELAAENRAPENPNDEYSFDKSVTLTLDPFLDIIGRNFKQPAEGLGRDNTPASWMWRTIVNPSRTL